LTAVTTGTTARHGACRHLKQVECTPSRFEIMAWNGAKFAIDHFVLKILYYKVSIGDFKQE